jgi:hypothetical protein
MVATNVPPPLCRDDSDDEILPPGPPDPSAAACGPARIYGPDAILAAPTSLVQRAGPYDRGVGSDASLVTAIESLDIGIIRPMAVDGAPPSQQVVRHIPSAPAPACRPHQMLSCLWCAPGSFKAKNSTGLLQHITKMHAAQPWVSCTHGSWSITISESAHAAVLCVQDKPAIVTSAGSARPRDRQQVVTR